MKTKLISLQTILLTVLVLFIFSASTNAQVSQELRTTVTRQFGIYSNDFAFFNSDG